MGEYAAAIYAITSLVVSAVGAGVSYSASSSAAKAQDQIGAANAAAQMANARNTAAQQQMALRFQKLQSDSQAAASNAQATAILMQNEAETAAAQEEIRRSRRQFEALVASNFAQLGKGNVSPTTGSPVDLLMENAAAQVDAEMFARDQDENRRRAAVGQAVAAKGGAFSAGVNSALLSLESDAAGMRGRMGVAQARLDQAGNAAAARGSRLGALASLGSSLGSTAMSGAQFYRSYVPKAS